MQQLLLLRTARAVRLSMVAIVLLLLNSCNKLEEQPSPTVQAKTSSQLVKQEDVQLLRQLFSDKQYDKHLIQEVNGRDQTKGYWTWTPLWNEAFQKGVSDPVTTIYIPLEARQQVEPYVVIMVGTRRYLVINRSDEKVSFSIATYIYPELKGGTQKAGASTNHQAFFATFNGVVMLKDLATGDESRTTYKQGVKGQQKALQSGRASSKEASEVGANGCTRT